MYSFLLCRKNPPTWADQDTTMPKRQQSACATTTGFLNSVHIDKVYKRNSHEQVQIHFLGCFTFVYRRAISYFLLPKQTILWKKKRDQFQAFSEQVLLTPQEN